MSRKFNFKYLYIYNEKTNNMKKYLSTSLLEFLNENDKNKIIFKNILLYNNPEFESNEIFQRINKLYGTKLSYNTQDYFQDEFEKYKNNNIDEKIIKSIFNNLIETDKNKQIIMSIFKSFYTGKIVENHIDNLNLQFISSSFTCNYPLKIFKDNFFKENIKNYLYENDKIYLKKIKENYIGQNKYFDLMFDNDEFKWINTLKYIQKGNKVPVPYFLLKDNIYYVMGGSRRLLYCLIFDIVPKFWIFKYNNDKITENEFNIFLNI